MDEAKRAIVRLLNDLFHEESVKCMNLKTMLEMMVANDPPIEDENVLKSIAILIATLDARQKLQDFATEHFYSLRGVLENA